MNEVLSLKDFIGQTLAAICGGVEQARSKHNYIAPQNHLEAYRKDTASVVHFDVAVIVSDTKTSEVSGQSSVGGGLGISVLKAKADVSDSREEKADFSSSKESRIKFSVPVYFQYDEKTDKENENENRNRSQYQDGTDNREHWMNM